MAEAQSRSGFGALVVLWLMPLFFCSNLVIGRSAVPTVEPFTLAFLRWLCAFAILVPIAGAGLRQHAGLIRAQWKLLLLMAFLAMWICGGLVYVALRHTTASNATLIYTSSPVFILLLEWAFRGRAIRMRETIGIVLALAGITLIVVKGSLATLASMRFNPGDLLILGASVSWAVYSVLSRREELKPLPNAVTFASVAGIGAVLLAPFAAAEVAATGHFPATLAQWQSIGGLALVSSVLAFLSFQFGIRAKGPAVTGIYMYLMPPYGVLLSVVFLGETLEGYHGAGFALILGGLVLATAPIEALRARFAAQA